MKKHSLGKMEMVDRPFSSFRVGESCSFVREITDEEVSLFAGLSGDQNHLHTDNLYASTTRYGRRIVHGLLVTAPISTLAGHLLPGKRCLLLSVQVRLLKPVFPGDWLTYRGTILHLSNATQVLKVGVEVTNQEGAVVLKGSYEGQVLSSEPTKGAS